MSELVHLFDEVINNVPTIHFGHKETIPNCSECDNKCARRGIRQITYCDIKDSTYNKLIVHKRRFYCPKCKKYSKQTAIPGTNSDFKVTNNAMTIITNIIEKHKHWDKSRLASKLNRKFGIKIGLARKIINKHLGMNPKSNKKLENDYLELF